MYVSKHHDQVKYVRGFFLCLSYLVTCVVIFLLEKHDLALFEIPAYWFKAQNHNNQLTGLFLNKDVQIYKEALCDVALLRTNNISNTEGVRGRKTNRSMCLDLI